YRTLVFVLEDNIAVIDHLLHYGAGSVKGLRNRFRGRDLVVGEKIHGSFEDADFPCKLPADGDLLGFPEDMRCGHGQRCIVPQEIVALFYEHGTPGTPGIEREE